MNYAQTEKKTGPERREQTWTEYMLQYMCIAMATEKYLYNPVMKHVIT